MKKYFFPLNYTYSNKLLGIIEYKLFIPLCILSIIIFKILSFFKFSFFTKFGIFITLVLPIFLLLNTSFNHEPAYLFLYSVLKHKFSSNKYIKK